MKEIRIDDAVCIKFKNGVVIEGTTLAYGNDRVLIHVTDEDIEKSKSINELDEAIVTVHTRYGIKFMNSCVISKIDGNNNLLIENNDAYPITQKREFVRVFQDLSFDIFFKQNTYKCKCINISAGGIAFTTSDIKFNLEDDVKIMFSSHDFGKDISCTAKIIKSENTFYVAKYLNIDTYNQDCIVKYVFKVLREI